MKSYHTLPVLFDGACRSQPHSTPTPCHVTFRCYGCDSGFQTQEHLVEHMQTKHGISTTHACPECQNIFISSESLNIHRETCHGSNVSPASTPLPVFRLDQHVLYNHTENLTVHCNYCEATFQHMRLLNIHVVEHHSQDHFSPSQHSTGDLSDYHLFTALRILLNLAPDLRNPNLSEK